MPRAAKKADRPTGALAGKAKTAEHWDMFFETMTRLGGNVSRACELCHITRNAVYAAREKDPKFEARFLLAKNRGVDAMEDEATRRAFEGVEEPVGFFQGVSTEVKVNYSDSLIQFLLKANRPEKFRERITTENINLNSDAPGIGRRFSKMTDEEIAAELKRRGLA